MLSATTAWARQCSLETLKGTYGALEQGTVVETSPGFPFAPSSIAVLIANPTFDGAGHFSGTYSASAGGYIVMNQAFTGTYAITPECDYTDTFTPQPTGVAVHHTGFITGEGMVQEIHYIYSDAGIAISGTAKKTPGSCSLESLKGTHALYGHGVLTAQFLPSPPPPVVLTQAGFITFDGKGRFSGMDTASTGGLIQTGDFTGTYTVNTDCTASATIHTIVGELHETGVITGEGQFTELRGIFTDMFWSFVEMTKRR